MWTRPKFFFCLPNYFAVQMNTSCLTHLFSMVLCGSNYCGTSKTWCCNTFVFFYPSTQSSCVLFIASFIFPPMRWLTHPSAAAPSPPLNSWPFSGPDGFFDRNGINIFFLDTWWFFFIYFFLPSFDVSWLTVSNCARVSKLLSQLAGHMLTHYILDVKMMNRLFVSLIPTVVR